MSPRDKTPPSTTTANGKELLGRNPSPTLLPFWHQHDPGSILPVHYCHDPRVMTEQDLCQSTLQKLQDLPRCRRQFAQRADLGTIWGSGGSPLDRVNVQK